VIVAEVLLLMILPLTERQECETNAHDFDEEEDVEPDLDSIWETNVMNHRDPKTGRYLGNKSGNKSTGFKKGQNYCFPLTSRLVDRCLLTSSDLMKKPLLIK